LLLLLALAIAAQTLSGGKDINPPAA